MNKKYDLLLNTATKIVGENLINKKLKTVHEDREGLKDAMMILKRKFDEQCKVFGVDEPDITVQDGKAHYLH